jgi:hypothetical protein
MRFLTASFAAFVMLLAPAAAAQITVRNFAEAYGEEQPVSGRGFVGAVMVDAAGPIALDKLEVFVPKGHFRRCEVSRHDRRRRVRRRQWMDAREGSQA